MVESVTAKVATSNFKIGENITTKFSGQIAHSGWDPLINIFVFLCFFGLGVAALVYLATFTALYAFLWLLRL